MRNSVRILLVLMTIILSAPVFAAQETLDSSDISANIGFGLTIDSDADGTLGDGEAFIVNDKTVEVFYAETGARTEVKNTVDVIITSDSDSSGTGNVSIVDGATTVATFDDSLTTLSSTDTSITGTLAVTGDADFSTLSTTALATLNSASITTDLDVDGATTTDGITNDGNIGTTTLSTTALATLNSASITTDLDVDGATTTDGITNDGNIGTTTLSTTGLATLDSASITTNLDVDGATTTDGITNDGNIGTTTLSTTGLATLDSASITTNLDVDGATTTDGITNDGNIGTTTLSTTGLATLDSASITNNATVGGTLDVTGNTTLGGTLDVTGEVTGTGGMAISGGATTLTSADTDTVLTVNDSGFTLNNDSTGTGSDTSSVTVSDTNVVLAKIDSGNAVTNSITVGNQQTAIIGSDSFNYGTTIDGGALVNGDLGVNGNIYSFNPDGSLGVNVANNGLNVEGTSNTVTLIADSNSIISDGRGQITLQEDALTVQVVNSTTSQSHGLDINQQRTVLSGGTTSTNLTLNDDGATFDDNNGGPASVTGVADGNSRYDAVNYGQLEDVKGGVAAVSAMASIPPLPTNMNFSLSMGAGTFDNQNAFAVAASARFRENVTFQVKAGRSPNQPWAAGIGATFSW